MSAIKQIEVNGTTYDINTFGSDLPVICETLLIGGSVAPDAIASALHDKHYTATGTDFTYTLIESPVIFLRAQEGNSDKAIVFVNVESDE